MRQSGVAVGFVVFSMLAAGGGAAWAQSAIATSGVIESSRGGFRFPDGSLQLSAAAPGPLENVLRVSPSGGDFTTVEDALASIVSPGPDNRYLVLVGPGVYDETELLIVPGYVHLRGAGRNVTEIRSARSTSGQHTGAAVVWLFDRGRISDLTIRNSGNSDDYSFGVSVADGATRETVLDNVLVEADGAGGVGHFAVFTRNGEPSILRSTLRGIGADAASSSNAGLYLQNAGGSVPFPRPLVFASALHGATDDECKGSAHNGQALAMNRHSPVIVDSVVCGTYRAIYVGGTAGTLAEVRGSHLEVGTATGAHLVTISQYAVLKISTSAVFYEGAGLKFDAGSMTCVHSHKADYTAANATCG